MAASAAHASARPRRRAHLLCFALAFLATAAFAAPEDFPEQTLEPIDALLASQAWQLALRAIDSAQRAQIGPRWQELERRRLLVYRNVSDVAAFAARIEQLPPDTSAEFRHWALEQLAETALAARDFARARPALERLLAGSEGDDARRWRERLARAYLAEDRTADALAAFAPLAAANTARPLHAEILLRAGRDREAFERVAGLKSPEAALWRLIAAKRLGLYAPADVVRELALLVRELRDRPDLQRLAWLVRADAAGQIGEIARRVSSLEQAFRLDPTPATGLVAAVPDDLWSAYFALARHVARTEHLTLGEAALARADVYGKKDAYTARALYAWNAAEAKDADVQARAHERLVRSLSVQKLTAVVRALYTESRRYTFADIPAVRYALMSDALSRGDLHAAAKYARDLEAPPTDVSPAEWDLRRARVLLFGGAEDAAIELLKRLLAAGDMDVEFARRFLQVVFDLQAMGKHRDALMLLESAYARVDNARMHRELLYWEAESAAALNDFGDAAELYLRSARFAGDDGSDPWGQSARFRAADALVKAGLRKDAEAVYRGLLKETADPEQRLLLEQHIERLWLVAPPATTP